MTTAAAGISFSSTISLGVVILGVLTVVAAAWAVWRTQSIAALRQANIDLRSDRDDWKERYEAQVTDNHRLEQKVQDLSTQVARLQGMTDTTLLAKDSAIVEFRGEVREALAKVGAHDERMLELLAHQAELVQVLVSRDPALRTRSTDQ
jgi:hypothetical protein